ncbi:MAG: hypothetical protein IK077_10855 [Thermoguttaceae bacterium]|nr:hypothetical protein [Thermoguttaceae bacterium]
MINKAIDAICQLNADEKLREQIRVQQKAEYDYGNGIAVARDEGMARGMARGMAKGMAKGRAEGRAEGIIEEKKASAKKLRQKGWTVEEIAEFQGVSPVEVEIWLGDK